MKKQFHSIDGILVNKELTEVKFACDLLQCKGACCTIESDFGAPLRESELEQMQKCLPAAMEYLPAEHKEQINKYGFYEYKQGEYLTRSYQKRACVLVYYQEGIAKCSLEKAYFEGKTSFRKPVSCHLFPIRISDFGGDILRYERLADCNPALQNGMKEGTTIAEFCRESLERNYSPEWYSKLKTLNKLNQ